VSDDTKPTVFEALAAVMGELRGIGKDDKSPEGYAYRGIEAVTRQLQPLFAKHGIVIAPCAEVLATVPSPAMKEGWQDVIMRVEWTIYGPDGSSLKATTNGVGRDRSDKGANKAQTQAFKYLLLHLLCISDAKDDSDGQTYEDGRVPERDMITAKDAKDRLLEATAGDKDAASRAWQDAGLKGKHRITPDQMAKAMAQIADSHDAVSESFSEAISDREHAAQQGQLVEAGQ
jgi:hypothetical protein